MNNQNQNQDLAISQEVNAVAGAISVEQSRAVQEVQGAIVMAKKFPRNETACFNKILEACKRKNLAESAVYSYPKGGSKVSGPSIRLAETLAKYWGNIQFGIVEMSQQSGVSEVMAYAWDLETNTKQIKQFNVKHSRYSRKGGVTKLTDPRDIYEMTANQGARRVRACILGIMPTDIIESATEECEKTLRGSNKEPLIDRVRTCVSKFSEISVTQEMIEARFGHKIDVIDVHELVSLGKIFNSIRDNMAKIEDFFEKPQHKPTPVLKKDADAINKAQEKLLTKSKK